MRRSFSGLVGPFIVSAVFALTVYGSISSARDLTTTETPGQRLVAILGTGYGLAGIAALYGLWMRKTWFLPVVVAWALLVTATASSAVAVYEGDLRGVLSAGVATMAIAAPIVWWARRRARQ